MVPGPGFAKTSSTARKNKLQSDPTPPVIGINPAGRLWARSPRRWLLDVVGVNVCQPCQLEVVVGG